MGLFRHKPVILVAYIGVEKRGKMFLIDPPCANATGVTSPFLPLVYIPTLLITPLPSHWLSYHGTVHQLHLE